MDKVSDTVDLAILFGVIQKKGSWFSIIDLDTGEILGENVSTEDGDVEELYKFQGKASLLEFLNDRPVVFEIVEKQVLEKLG